MKTLRLCLKGLIILGMITSNTALSALYTVEWPSLISPRWSEVYYTGLDCGGGCRTLEFTIRSAVVPISVDPSTTTLRQMTGGSITHRAESYTRLTRGVWWQPSDNISADMTLSAVHERINKRYPNGGSVRVVVALSGVPEYVCGGVGVGVPASSVGISWAGYQYNRYFGGLSADESCTNVPPNPDEYCAMATPSVTMAYGTLTSSTAQNAKATASVRVQCSSTMKYVLRLPGRQKSIYLSNGMSAEITANGKALGSTLNGDAGSNVVTITSILTGTPTRTGSFSGSSVLGVEYP